MPSSHTYQLNEIMELVILTEPKSILDIGCGFGKFGVLCYERLNLWYAKNYKNKNIAIDGIEGFPEYITPIHEFVYSNIYINDALTAMKNLTKKYDLALLIDVLEHLPRAEGEKLLYECLKVCKNIIVSTPKNIGDQGAEFGNEYEVHRAQWDREDFGKFGNYFVIPNRFSHIIYQGKDLERVRKNSYYFKELWGNANGINRSGK